MSLLKDFQTEEDGPYDKPLQMPVTILDLERTTAVLDMTLPMADPCPACGAFNMTVGDYVCHGECWPCAEHTMANFYGEE